MEPKRLLWLDALRGIAALSIIFWHWQHFFAVGGDDAPWVRESQPLFWLFKPLYLQGWAAVDIFFCLSGFVVFWLYADSVREGRVSAGRYAVARLARLYPLSLLMLLAAAVLQWLYWRQNETFFIYQDNDVLRFVQNLFLVQAWWGVPDQSFDGPAWAVSMEVLLYIGFFVLCRLGLKAGWGSLAIALAGAAVTFFNEHLGRALMGFFIGGCAFQVWRTLRTTQSSRRVAHALGLATLAGWSGLFFFLYRSASFLGGGEGNAGFLIGFDLVLCPLTVLWLALSESSAERSASAPVRGLVFLGDISFSTYMIHFPLQVSLALIANTYDVEPAFFMQAWVMGAFYAVLIVLGWLSYRFFERPAQAIIRGWGTAKSQSA
jgi:peptidoglycan/LPS O-acetylase OafA/YrhL